MAVSAAALMGAGVRAQAATGDILSVAIETNGWQALVVVAGLGTGGSYGMGLGPNATVDPPAAPKLVLSVASQGFDDSGIVTSLTRTIYGTKPVRRPFPNHEQMDESASAGNVTVRIALSDFIYPDCSDIRASILDGLYAEGGRPNRAANNVAVANHSTQPHAQTLGNWSWPGYDRITGDSFTLRCVVFHRSGQNGRPVRAVKFWAADEHGNRVTNWVTTPAVDPAMGDATPVIEYVGSLSSAALTQGDVITCNFKAYPWIGNESATLDTSDGVYSNPPQYCPQYRLCDRTGGYGVTVAVVDAAGGSDASGRAVDEAAFSTNNPPPGFGTIAGAAHAIAGTNNLLRSRDDVGGGIIYLREGSHNWVGASSTYGATPRTWLTITRYPDAIAANVRISGQSGNQDLSHRIRLEEVAITSTASTFNGLQDLWLHRCQVDSTSQFLFQTVNRLWLTASTVINWGDGLNPPAGQTLVPVLVRGNDLSGLMGNCFSYYVLGNSAHLSGSAAGPYFFHRDDTSPAMVPPSTNTVFAYNVIYHWNNSASQASLVDGNNTSMVNTHGFAIVQNLLENVTGGAQALLWEAADSSDNQPSHNTINHGIVWNNTLAGQRMNCAYNDYGTEPAWRLNWSMKQNIMFKHATKSDDFPSPGDGGRVGNWPVSYGVGAVGNMFAEIQGISGAGSFLSEFPGLSSHQPATTTHPAGNWLQFVDPKCYDGTTRGAGGGDYHLRTNSPAFALGRELLLPFDLAGIQRRPDDPPGAYSARTEPSIELSATYSEGLVVLEFQTVVGSQYRIEARDDLGADPWRTLEDNIPGTGQPHVYRLSPGGTIQQYYRVRLL